MREIQVKREIVNVEALNEALKDALGDVILGISAGPDGVIAYLADDATAEQSALAQKLIEQHDPTVLTPEQHVKLEQIQQLEQVRALGETNPLPVDGEGYKTVAGLTDEALLRMAQKVAWLEREIAATRGLA
jgi:hypothetical protein